MSRKEVERLAKRSFIIEKAALLFGQKGVENTSMDEIARTVDYTRRTLYNYFKNSDDICVAVLVAQQKERWAIQRTEMAKVDSGYEKLKAWAESLYRYFKLNPQALRLEIYCDFHGIMPESISEEIFSEFDQLNNELADGLRHVFNLGAADGSLRPDLDIDKCISQFVVSLRAILQKATSASYSFTSINSDEYVAHYLDLLCKGLCRSDM